MSRRTQTLAIEVAPILTVEANRSSGKEYFKKPKVAVDRLNRKRRSSQMDHKWNEDLTALRKPCTYWRNPACAMRRQGRDDEELCKTATRAKRLFH